jgi:acetoacetate decarboxylase
MSNGNNVNLPKGRLDISALPNNQPASAPLYPPFPWKMFGGKAIVVNYETDMDAVLDLLPPELTPMTDPPIVSCFLNGGYEFAIGGGAYCEMAPLLGVMYEGEPHIFPWVVYLGSGTEEWFAAGREVLGDSKKLAKIELKQELGQAMMLGTVERPAGHRLVTMVAGPFDRQGDENDFVLYPNIVLRLLPSGEAGNNRPQVAELVRKRVKATIRTAEDGSPMIFHGPGTIELGRSEQDPLYKLPVRNVLGSLFIEFGTIEQPAGEVLKRYGFDED